MTRKKQIQKNLKRRLKDIPKSHHKTNLVLIGIIAAVAVVALLLLYSSTSRDVAGQAYAGSSVDCEGSYQQCMAMAEEMADLYGQWENKYGEGYDSGYCGNMYMNYEQHCDVQKAQCESNALAQGGQPTYEQPDSGSYGQGIPEEPNYATPPPSSYEAPPIYSPGQYS